VDLSRIVEVQVNLIENSVKNMGNQEGSKIEMCSVNSRTYEGRTG
jgi:hypothetical protein